MKIIGGHDYYDGAGMGVDPGIILVRSGDRIANHPLKLPRATGDRRRLVQRDAREDFLSFFLVLVAGEMFPGARHIFPRRQYRVEGSPAWTTERVEILHDPDAIRAVLDEFGWTLKNNRFGCDRRSAIEAFLSRTGQGPWTNWMVDAGAAIVVASRDDTGPDFSVGGNPVLVRHNPAHLKALEFFRVMDPATIHMRLQDWIGGVLPSGKEAVEISDSSRIVKAGFDRKTSFRRTPGKKRPRKSRAR